LVSANVVIKNILNIGNRGSANQTLACPSTILWKFKVPENNSTETSVAPKATSYEIL